MYSRFKGNLFLWLAQMMVIFTLVTTIAAICFVLRIITACSSCVPASVLGNIVVNSSIRVDPPEDITVWTDFYDLLLCVAILFKFALWSFMLTFISINVPNYISCVVDSGFRILCSKTTIR